MTILMEKIKLFDWIWTSSCLLLDKCITTLPTSSTDYKHADTTFEWFCLILQTWDCGQPAGVRDADHYSFHRFIKVERTVRNKLLGKFETAKRIICIARDSAQKYAMCNSSLLSISKHLLLSFILAMRCVRRTINAFHIIWRSQTFHVWCKSLKYQLPLDADCRLVLMVGRKMTH